MFRNLAVCSFPPPAPGPALSPWGGVVFIRGQEHLQRELLMPPVRPQPALAASPRTSLSVCNIIVRPHTSTSEVNTKTTVEV